MLTVGERSVTLTCEEGDNACVLRTYLHLVTEQREVALDRSVALRRDDLIVLAELLDLEDARLEHQLARILRLSDPDATALRRELLRQRVALAAIGVSLVAGIPVTRGIAAADEADDTNPVVVTVTLPGASSAGNLDLTDPPASNAVTVEVAPPKPLRPPAAPSTTLAPVAAAPAPTPAVAPPAADPAAVEIGHSVTYERDPDFVAPEGVEIGDAMVIERDPEPT